MFSLWQTMIVYIGNSTVTLTYLTLLSFYSLMTEKKKKRSSLEYFRCSCVWLLICTVNRLPDLQVGKIETITLKAKSLIKIEVNWITLMNSIWGPGIRLQWMIKNLLSKVNFPFCFLFCIFVNLCFLCVWLIGFCLGFLCFCFVGLV